MDHSRAWPIVLVLALLVLIGAPAGLVAAQDQGTPDAVPGAECDPIYGDEIDVTADPERATERDGGQQWDMPYRVDFLFRYSAIPFCFYPEPMEVVVETGQYALVVGTESVVRVDPPPGQEIRLIKDPVEGPVEDGYVPPYFVATDEVLLSGNVPCTADCEIPADPEGRRGVLVTAGSTVRSEGGVTCLWCLLNAGTGGPDDGTPSVSPAGGAEDPWGVLRVVAVIPNTGNRSGDAASFSWTRFTPRDDRPGGYTPFPDEPQGSAAGVRMGWGAFNPGASCIRGGG